MHERFRDAGENLLAHAYAMLLCSLQQEQSYWCSMQRRGGGGVGCNSVPQVLLIMSDARCMF